MFLIDNLKKANETSLWSICSAVDNCLICLFSSGRLTSAKGSSSWIMSLDFFLVILEKKVTEHMVFTEDCDRCSYREALLMLISLQCLVRMLLCKFRLHKEWCMILMTKREPELSYNRGHWLWAQNQSAMTWLRWTMQLPFKLRARHSQWWF